MNRNEDKDTLVTPGTFSSAATFIALSPNQSLGYILADEGYDVWLLNPRGTIKDTQKNLYINKETNKRAFYNYSWHEIGVFDNPAAIDYILNHTNTKQLHYIGHSQGCTTFFVMASERPEYNDKIRLASMLAPSAFLVTQTPLAKLAIPFSDFLIFFTRLLHIYDIPYIAVNKIVRSICSHSAFYFICATIYDSTMGYPNHDQLNEDILRKGMQVLPVDGSVLQLFHYLQVMKAGGRFQQFDYGRKGNMRQYNSSIPPVYDVSKITAPLALYVGENDMFVSVKNADTLKSYLRQEPYYYIVPYKKWNHGDFLMAKDVVRLLYNEVLTVMSRYEN